jgi:hypothetical protein
MYNILLFFKRLKENEGKKRISVNGMTFNLIRGSQDLGNKNVIRKIDEVSDYQTYCNALTEYVKTE